MDKEIVKAMANKFSRIFATKLTKHRKICRRGLTHVDATPTFKNCPNTYETPCSSYRKFYFTDFVQNLLHCNMGIHCTAVGGTGGCQKIGKT